MTSQTKTTDTDEKTVSGFGHKGAPGDKHLPENSDERLDSKLDDAVEETFPSSDPVSVKITK